MENCCYINSWYFGNKGVKVIIEESKIIDFIDIIFVIYLW